VGELGREDEDKEGQERGSRRSLYHYAESLVRNRDDVVGCYVVPAWLTRDGCQLWNMCFSSTRDVD